MFSHVMLGADDPAAVKPFYDATLGALGAQPGMIDDKGRLVYMHSGGIFIVSKPIDGEPACHANGGTVGFAAASPEQASPEQAGGTTCEDPPGV
ncbi:MAG: VOC family protein, partial [Sphingomonadaceae bacterium]|nr:VOC family protein [Sphingomonadaceae bacterium]